MIEKLEPLLTPSQARFQGAKLFEPDQLLIVTYVHHHRRIAYTKKYNIRT